MQFEKHNHFAFCIFDGWSRPGPAGRPVAAPYGVGAERRAADDRPYGVGAERRAADDRPYGAFIPAICHLPPVTCYLLLLTCYLFCSSQTRSTATSAGLTPEILEAWPMETGRIRASFSRASSFRAGMAL